MIFFAIRILRRLGSAWLTVAAADDQRDGTRADDAVAVDENITWVAGETVVVVVTFFAERIFWETEFVFYVVVEGVVAR